MFRFAHTFAILFLFAGSAKPAGILFSNLVEPGSQYGPDAIGIGHTPAHSEPDGITLAATRFSINIDSVLTAFQVPVDIRSGPNELSAYLLTEENGHPGTLIESYDVPVFASGFPPPFTSVPSSARPVLRANTPYWLAITASPETFGGWTFTLFQGDPQGSSDFAVATEVGGVRGEWSVGTSGPTGREGALVVIGEAVPEPASSLSIGSGLLLAFALSRFRRMVC